YAPLPNAQNITTEYVSGEALSYIRNNIVQIADLLSSTFRNFVPIGGQVITQRMSSIGGEA
ncbi:MAG TPA: hypothetical protein VHX39_02110, partial [Acetobacteraceae bacterium]|nr:hypothetical protein [Acetobacteraceae bacterium]